MANTPNFGIPLYTTSDTAKLDTLLNGQATALDTNLMAAMSTKGAYRVGTNTQRLALSGGNLYEGLKFYCTDTDREWLYNGTAWIAADGTITPTSLVGATVDANGYIIPTSGQSLIRLNGIFSSRARAYQFIFSLSSSTSSGGVNLNLTAGGTAYTGSTHNIQRLTSSAGSTASLPLANLGVWSGSGVTGSNIFGEWIIRNPATAGIKSYTAEAMVAPGTTQFSRENGWIGNVDANVYDGIQLSATGGTFAGGFLKVQPVG